MDKFLFYKAWLCLTVVVCYCEGRTNKNKTEETEKGKRVFTFAFSNDGFPSNYVLNGELVGHSVDLTHAVCKFAGQDCETVLVQRKQCWDSTRGFPPFSAALNGRYFSSCASYQESPERTMTYGFGEETYFNSPIPAIITSKKSSITLQDLEDCNDLRLAYPANTVLEPDCLLDNAMFVREKNYVPVTTTDDFKLTTIMTAVIEKVVLGEADLGIVLTRFTRTDEVRVLRALPCSGQIEAGINNMFRKDDTELISWWGDSLHKFLCSSDYEVFCKALREDEKYSGVDPLCRVPGQDLDCSKFGGPKVKPQNEDPVRRINPCISEVCRERHDLNFNTYRENFYEFLDKEDRNPEKALDGNEGDTYSGTKKHNVEFLIKTVEEGDDVVFRPDRICLTVKNVKGIKFTFRGGAKESEDRNVLIDFRQEWTKHCESSDLFRQSVKIELTITTKFVTFARKKDNKIRVKEMFLNGCTKEAFVTE